MLLSACQVQLRTPAIVPSPTPIPATATPAASPTPAATATSPAPKVEQIVPSVISGSLMLKQTRQVIRLEVDGKSTDGEQMSGDLSMVRTHSADLRQSSAEMSGSLSQRVLSLMEEDEVKQHVEGSSIYRLKDGTFWVMDYGDQDYGCVKLDSNERDLFSSQSTLADTLLQDVQKYLYGIRVGEDNINGIPVWHYVVDAEASNHAAGQITDWYIKRIVSVLDVVDGDVYLAREGSYLVSLRLNYEGKLSDLDFEGKVHLAYDHSYPEKAEPVTLPKVCDTASALADLPGTIDGAALFYVTPFKGLAEGAYKSVTTLTLNGKDSDGKAVLKSTSVQQLEDRAQKRRVLIIDGALFAGMSGQGYLEQYGLQRVSLYDIDDAIYMVTEAADHPSGVCTNLSSKSGSDNLDAISPEQLARWLLDNGTVYGVPMGKATVNGDMTYHFRLAVEAMQTVHKHVEEIDPNETRPELVNGDIYMSESGYHLVRMTANYTGGLLLFDFTGRIKVQYDLTSPREGVNIQLPAVCQSADKS
jgi:hypothetical protein